MSTTKTRATDLTACTACGGRFVYPLRWRDIGDPGWWLEMYCPECDTLHETEAAHETVEALDAALNARTDALITDLAQLERENMQADIDRIVAALEVDAILPWDFGPGGLR